MYNYMQFIYNERDIPMTKKKLFVHAAALTALVAVLCVAMFFIRITFVEGATGKTSGYFINDVFDAPVVEFSHGKTVEQEFSAAGNIYGMRVRFHNGAVTQAGTFEAQLVKKESGEIVASTTGATGTLVNDNYSAIHFDQPYITNETNDYILKLTPTFENPNAYMRIWSDAEGEDISFGVINYVADSAAVFGWYRILWVMVVAVGILLYTVCFIFKFKKENVFLVALLCTSLLFTTVLPPFSSPDEEGHFTSAYQLANRIEGENFKWTGNVIRRAEDYNDVFEDRNTTVFSYEHIYKNFFKTAESDEQVFSDNNWIVYDFEGVYTAGALGILLGKALNLGFVPLMYLGRLFNLAVFALCAYFAVKITPIGKEIFMAASFLPITLHIANSFSRDVFVISMGFIFVAYLLKLLHQEEKYTVKQLVLLVIIAVLLAPSKYIYSLMCPLILLLKPQNLGIKLKNKTDKKHKWLPFAVVGGILVLLGAVVLATNSWALVYIKGIFGTGESLESLLVNNPDATFNLGLLLQNPFVAFKLFINTIYQNGAYYLKSIMGGVLGYNSIYISDAFLFVIVLMVALSTCCMPSDEHTLAKKERFGFAAAFLLVFAAVIYVAVCWTPVTYTSLYGVQGKYLLPAFPLLLLACKNKVVTIKKDIFNHICFVMSVTNIFVVLNALTIILQR